jgi:hypothetical protein
MTTIIFLKNQVIETRKFTNRMISDMPEDLWFTIPKDTNSNFAWQIGHILMAQNFHVFACALGRNQKITEIFPIQEYSKIFRGLGSSERSVEKGYVTSNKLKRYFDFVYEQCLEGLDKATDDILHDKLEPIPFKHPVANNKYEAISWSFKHEMWHCAEMEQIKLQLGKQMKWVN